MLRLAYSATLFRRVVLQKKVGCIALSRSINSTSSSKSVQPVAKPPKRPNWNRVISEAEKIVDYPSSYLGLRWLLNDDVANIVLNMRRLIGSSHPLLKTAKNLVQDESQVTQAWGLIVLLLSKTAGHACEFTEEEFVDKTSGILNKQRALAEICEMIRLSQFVHQGMVNLQNLKNAGNDLSADSEMIVGNKIALLGGDYLLGNACIQLADLRNSEIQELISTVVRDLAESNFIGERDEQNNPLPSDPSLKIHVENPMPIENFNDVSSVELSEIIGYPEREWTFRHTLGSGSLLGKSCQGTLSLSGHPENIQRLGYLFGKHLALAWEANKDLEPFQFFFLPYEKTFSLISAPVLFHLDHDPSLYEEIKKGVISVDNVDFQKVHEIVSQGPGVEKTKELQIKHAHIALEVLNKFPSCDAKSALEKIISSLLILA